MEGDETSRMQLSEVERALLKEGLRDWSGVWVVAGLAQSYHPDATIDEVRETAVSSIRNLLRSDLMVAGDLIEKAFVPWEMTADEAADRIDLEWKSLGRIPNPPESAWFELTVTGRDIAQELASHG